ncbi:MAG: hypothetical protein ABEJ27_05200 [Halodesulfurarchaeum sp.]
MAEYQTRTTEEQTQALFDKYVLPKVALTIILAASLVGTWLSTNLGGYPGAALTIARWAFLTTMGILTGGLVWKHVFIRPADLGDGAAAYCSEMYTRFDRIASGSLVVIGVASPIVVWGYLDALRDPVSVGIYGTLLGTWFAVLVFNTLRDASVDEQFRSLSGLLGLGLALGVVTATAVLEVAIRGFEPLAGGVRLLHLLAFAVWVGGAVWNIFVAVPTGQNRPTIGVIQAAGEQLERFRWAVRFIIPTLFATGLYQAYDVFGTALWVYVGHRFGLAILMKVGLIGLLVVIFKLCPMWRACSPIDGVCDVEDLAGSESDSSRQNPDPVIHSTGVPEDE